MWNRLVCGLFICLGVIFDSIRANIESLGREIFFSNPNNLISTLTFTVFDPLSSSLMLLLQNKNSRVKSKTMCSKSMENTCIISYLHLKQNTFGYNMNKYILLKTKKNVYFHNNDLNVPQPSDFVGSGSCLIERATPCAVNTNKILKPC